MPSTSVHLDTDLQMRDCCKVLPAIFLVLSNVFCFSTLVFKTPPLLLLTNLLLVVIGSGGIVKLVRSPKGGEEASKKFLSPDTVDKISKALVTKINFVSNKAVDIIFWEDPIKSSYALAILYVSGLVTKILPTVLIVYTASWALFLYVYMHETLCNKVYPKCKPYVDKASSFLYNLYYSIPKLNEDKMI
ncbi:uncharacterized protein BEWA_040650 [Theileria equi strain WA]|uniref:Membrane protein, putative n=1 Tax=Theileria equi strain WA TaxID=1537102 RepID=L1LF08_THEEQ|nr:uncharacterized protein BEWA_040650 [Theileria equi strain WA]EKX74027.1 membrane protein, putative [Theileria equi strain WA]|eukprot:XP_004833479.1 uncharacterized protein BEWA_040650 [Theileria equi strain WA]